MAGYLVKGYVCFELNKQEKTNKKVVEAFFKILSALQIINSKSLISSNRKGRSVSTEGPIFLQAVLAICFPDFV